MKQNNLSKSILINKNRTGKSMKYLKIFVILGILPYLASFTGCQNSDKQTSKDEMQPQIQTTDLEAPPSSKEDLKPLKMGLTNQTQSDGNLNRVVLSVNYQQQSENFNTQDKRMIVRSDYEHRSRKF
jgi:hypothetical protein